MQTPRAIRSFPALRPDAGASDDFDDVLFLVVDVSDGIRRGVRYFSLEGQALPHVNAVLEALITDGEVAYDDSAAAQQLLH